MNGKELKEVWHSGTPSFGAFVTSTDPMVSAIICNVGFEWLILDAEHAPLNPETLRNLVAVVRSRGTVPIIRVADNNAALIKQALDLGAEGIMVPLLQTAEDARRAVAACRYPPQGIRGYNPRDASNFFFEKDEYTRTINERVIVMLQVEHVPGGAEYGRYPGCRGGGRRLYWPVRPVLLPWASPADRPPRSSGRHGYCCAQMQCADIPVGTIMNGTSEELAGYIRRGMNFIIPYADFMWASLAPHPRPCRACAKPPGEGNPGTCWFMHPAALRSPAGVKHKAGLLLPV